MEIFPDSAGAFWLTATIRGVWIFYDTSRNKCVFKSFMIKSF